MSVQRGFYRHYQGHLYYVFGVACLKHEGNRRVVVYTSVQTEEREVKTIYDEVTRFDFLARDVREFLEEVDPETGKGCEASGHSCVCTSCPPRFQRVTDPEKSKLP